MLSHGILLEETLMPNFCYVFVVVYVIIVCLYVCVKETEIISKGEERDMERERENQPDRQFNTLPHGGMCCVSLHVRTLTYLCTYC